MKKLSSLLLALTMLLTVSCAKKSGDSSGNANQTAQEISVVQTLYKESQIALGERFYECESIQKCGDGYYFFYEDMSRELKLVTLDSSFTVSEPLPLGKSLSLGWGIYVHEDGSFTILSASTDFELEYTEYGTIENYGSFLREGSVSFALTDYDRSGNIISQRDVSGLEEYFDLGQGRLMDMIPYGDGEYLVSLSCGAAIIGEDGTLTDGQVYEQTVADFGLDTAGKPIMSMYHGFAYMDEGSLDIPKKLMQSEERLMLSSAPKTGDMGFSAFFAKDDGIYGLTGDDELMLVVDFRGSLIDSDEIADFAFCGDGQFLAAGRETDYLTLHTRRPDDYKENRKEVEIWQINIGTGDESATQFNKSNDDYLAKINPSLKSLDDLSKAILTGDSPDLIFYGNRSVLDGMINLGAAADIYPYMEAYDGVKADDIMPNVLEAFDMDGKLYAIPENFCVSSWQANSNIISEEYRNWTFDEMYELFEKCPDDMYFADQTFGSNDDGLFNELVVGYQTPWVDTEKHTCNFGSKDFVKLLEFCRNTKNQAVIMPDDIMDSEYMKKESTIMGERKAMLSLDSEGRYGLDIMADKLARKGLPMSEASLLNLPGGNGKGRITCDNCFTILSTGDCPDGAWAYVSYMLSEERQMKFGESNPGWNWTNKKAFETGMQNTITAPDNPQIKNIEHWEDGKPAFKFEYEVVVTEEDVERYSEFVMNCTELEYENFDISTILWEEWARYRNDEISAEECADNIQSRVEILLAEAA